MRTLRRIGILIFFLLIIPILILWVIVAQPRWGGNQKSSVTVSPEALEGHVRMLTETCFPRNYREIENLERAAEYIAGHLRDAGGRVRFQEFQVGKETYRNVVASFGDDEGARLVVGAHYDSHDLTPGADDNASGVAGLIELGYLIGDSRLKEENIELIAFTLEEPPFFGSNSMGSYQHARKLHDEGVEVRGMIALEMIGYFSEEPGSQSYPAGVMRLMYPSKGDFIAVIGNLSQRKFTRMVKKGMKGTTDLAVYSFNAPVALPGIDFSDHRNYWDFGFDAAMITDTAFYRNKAYHEDGDTADTLDYEKMGKVVVGVFESLKSLFPVNPR